MVQSFCIAFWLKEDTALAVYTQNIKTIVQWFELSSKCLYELLGIYLMFVIDVTKMKLIIPLAIKKMDYKVVV